MKGYARLAPLWGAVLLVFLEWESLVNTLGATRLVVGSALLGGAVGVFIDRQWFRYSSWKISTSVLVVTAALVGIWSGSVINRSAVDSLSIERFVVVEKWRSRIGKFRLADPWNMLTVKSPKYGRQDIAVDEATWSRAVQGLEIDIRVGRGRLGLDIVVKRIEGLLDE